MVLYVQSFPYSIGIQYLAMSAKVLFFKKGHWKIKFVPNQWTLQELICIMYTIYFTSIRACQALFTQLKKHNCPRALRASQTTPENTSQPQSFFSLTDCESEKIFLNLLLKMKTTGGGGCQTQNICPASRWNNLLKFY